MSMAVYAAPKIAGGGGSPRFRRHPAAADDLASVKGHLLAKGHFSPRLPGGGAAAYVCVCVRVCVCVSLSAFNKFNVLPIPCLL